MFHLSHCWCEEVCVLKRNVLLCLNWEERKVSKLLVIKKIRLWFPYTYIKPLVLCMGKHLWLMKIFNGHNTLTKTDYYRNYSVRKFNYRDPFVIGLQLRNKLPTELKLWFMLKTCHCNYVMYKISELWLYIVILGNMQKNYLIMFKLDHANNLHVQVNLAIRLLLLWHI